MDGGRRDQRSRQRLEVWLSDGEQQVFGEPASTENISLGGMRVQTARPWKPQSRLRVIAMMGDLRATARGRLLSVSCAEHLRVGTGACSYRGRITIQGWGTAPMTNKANQQHERNESVQIANCGSIDANARWPIAESRAFSRSDTQSGTGTQEPESYL